MKFKIGLVAVIFLVVLALGSRAAFCEDGQMRLNGNWSCAGGGVEFSMDFNTENNVIKTEIPAMAMTGSGTFEIMAVEGDVFKINQVMTEAYLNGQKVPYEKQPPEEDTITFTGPDSFNMTSPGKPVTVECKRTASK